MRCPKAAHSHFLDAYRPAANEPGANSGRIFVGNALRGVPVLDRSIEAQKRRNGTEAVPYEEMELGGSGNEAVQGGIEMLAKCQQRHQTAGMGVQITIRDVPEEVRDELAARAARARQSMQEFLRAELERLAARPPVDVWLEQVRERKRSGAKRVPRGNILRARDADRR